MNLLANFKECCKWAKSNN